jgi:putative colanic acid biosynthesis glycosyltransferase
MRVCLINSDSGYGSTGRITYDLSRAIIENGNEVRIGYGRECTEENPYNIKIGNKFHVYLHVLKTRLLDLQGFGSRGVTKSFINKIKKFKPDLIHLHNIHGSYINIELLFEYIKENKIPVVWTLHDCWSYTGHCANYTYVNCNKWESMCYDCVQKNIYPASILKDNSRNNFNRKKYLFCGVDNLTICTVSQWLKEEVSRSFLSGYECRVIPNGIDLSVFKPIKSNFRKKYQLEDKIILLGVASVWHDRKGLGLFNELADSIGEEYQIVLVGINKNQKKEVSHKIITIPRSNNIREIVKIYTAADILLNLSKEETFGMVTLEALACGTMVITNKYSANKEIVDETCGYIVDELSVGDLLTGIRHLLDESKDQRACRNKASGYEKKHIYDKYIKLYEEVLHEDIMVN